MKGEVVPPLKFDGGLNNNNDELNLKGDFSTFPEKVESELKCTNVLWYRFFCQIYIDDTGGSGGGGGAGRDWPDGTSCQNKWYQTVDCDAPDNGVCQDYVVDRSGVLPVSKLQTVECGGSVDYGHYCRDIQTKLRKPCGESGRLGEERTCMFYKEALRDNLVNDPYTKAELDAFTIGASEPKYVPCNDVTTCGGYLNASPDNPDWRGVVDCNVDGDFVFYDKGPGYSKGPQTCDFFANVAHKEVGGVYRNIPSCIDYENGLRQNYVEIDNVKLDDLCYHERGFRVDCKDLATYIPAPADGLGTPFITKFSNELPPMDCDICTFFEQCKLDFEMFMDAFWQMMGVLYEIKSYMYLMNELHNLKQISNAVNSLYELTGRFGSFMDGTIPFYFDKVTDSIESILEPLEGIKKVIEGMDLATYFEGVIDSISKMLEPLEDIKKAIDNLELGTPEVCPEGEKCKPTNFWDFLGGLFGDIFEFVEFLIEKVIYLVVPEDSSFITTSLSGLSDALSHKFEPMNVLKDSITSTFSVQEKEIEKVTVNLPMVGTIDVFDPTYINMYLPRFKQILSGIIMLLTVFWAYRKITTEMIK